MNLNSVKSVYFIGAGGIGMSALIRYFLANGKQVAGYDRTPSELTNKLISEGAEIHYEDDVTLIPDSFQNSANTLVVYTPAIPDSHSELNYFRANGYNLLKRSQVLGLITDQLKGLCIAGTHGKTTTSSMLAHILKQSHLDCNAFLGGILKNYDSNLLLSSVSELVVVEADEFDRSFHWLHPYMAVITAVDPDHLDIYGTAEAYYESFEKFISLIRPNGVLLINKKVSLELDLQENVKVYTYSAEKEGDFHAENIRIGNGTVFFDFVTPETVIKDIELGVPVKVNIENSVAAMAIAMLNGATPEEVRNAIKTFAGAHRRFEVHLKRKDVVLIDDYAHHPAELKASIESVRALYKGRHITGIFQPHLYSRTRDFAADFAASLSLLDELILLDIYPAREEPIPGVSSDIIFDKVTVDNKRMIKKGELLDLISKEIQQLDVVLMLGAGDIDRMVEPVKEILERK